MQPKTHTDPGTVGRTRPKPGFVVWLLKSELVPVQIGLMTMDRFRKCEGECRPETFGSLE